VLLLQRLTTRRQLLLSFLIQFLKQRRLWFLIQFLKLRRQVMRLQLLMRQL
jgi:hypothetical protein